ncbi:MAG: GatB/YqeY domain-containing protein [Candidatus Eremiobacteraeota bacterium]|nr:GatB/YqeY domain-containing protein [Candidatus Eremiobacteraeota bacterium]
MSLQERIDQDIKTAMKAREKERLNTLRMVKTAIKNEEIERRGPLDEASAVAVLIKLTKQRKDSIEQFDKAGREDLSAVERNELAIIEEYLPAAPSQAEIEAAVDKAIADTGADSMKQMGQVIKTVRDAFAGRPVDGAAISGLVKKKLS